MMQFSDCQIKVKQKSKKKKIRNTNKYIKQVLK